jgi:hypothetical protein
MPVVREIVADAEPDNYPIQALIMGVIMSDAFRMKDVLDPDAAEEIIVR